MMTPSRKRMRIEDGSSSSDGMLLEPSATMNDLPSEVMKNIFSFVDKGNYYFVAPVSKDFCYNYLTMDVIEDKFAHKLDYLQAIGRNKVTKIDAASFSFELAEYCFLKAPEDFQTGLVREAIRKGRKDILEMGLNMVNDVKEVMSRSFRFGRCLEDTARRGDVEMLKLLLEKGTEFKLFVSEIIFAAAYNGQLQILKWLHRNNLVVLSEDQKQIFIAAARSGNLSIIKWAKEVAGFNCPSDLINDAVESGSLEIVKYLRSKNMPWDDLTFGAAAGSGNIELLQYLLEKKCPHDDPWICANAIQRKDHEKALEVLEWLHDQGIPWDEETCEMAVEQDNLKALKFARSNGCPWNEECLEKALWHCNIELIEYCLQSGCPVGDSWNIFDSVMNDKDHDRVLRMLKLLRKFSVPWDKELCNRAASTGNLHALKWAVSQGCPWDKELCNRAASTGNLQTLKWAVSQGCPWDKEKCAYGAARLRNTETLKWIISQGCKLNEHIGANAALSGNLETFKWLLSLGCPYNEETSIKAIQSEKYAIVEYCIENGFSFTEELYEYTVDYFRDPFPIFKLFQNKQYPWNSGACKAAARAGDLKLLRWLRFQGCPWDEETCHQAVNYDNLDILKYAHENGCPWTKETYAYCFSTSGLLYDTDEIPADHQCPDQIIEYLQIHKCPQPNPDDWYTFSN